MDKNEVGLFDIINDISFGKQNIYNACYENKKKYNVFITNHILSQHIDCIMIINDLNTRSSISPQAHHDFLFRVITKKKRYAATAKPIKEWKIDIIKKAYGYSNERAIEVQDMISDTQYDEMVEMFATGGIK